MNQSFKVEPFDVRRYNNLHFNTQTATVINSFSKFDSPREPTSPTKMYPARNRSATPKSDNLYLPTFNELKGNQQTEGLQQLKLERVTVSPINYVGYRTQQNQKSPRYQYPLQMQNVQRNRFLTTTKVQSKQKKSSNGQSDFYQRYVALQMEVARLKNQNLDLKKEKQGLLLKIQNSHNQRQAQKLIQQLTAANQLTVQSLNKQRLTVKQLESRLMEYSSKLKHQMQRLKELSNKKQQFKQSYFQAQKIKEINQNLYKDNIILTKELIGLQKILQDQNNKYMQQIANMEKQIKQQHSYIAYLTDNKDKQIKSLQQKVKKYEKAICEYNQQKGFESVAPVDRIEMKLTSMRQHSIEQQKKRELEKKFNDLQKIAEQLYQTATRFLASDVIKDVAQRYIFFKQKYCSQINSQASSIWKVDEIPNNFKRDNIRPTSLK